MSVHPFPLDGNDPRAIVSWQSQLDHAMSPAEVVALARDYLASFSPYDLAALPEVCRPAAKLYDDEDVTTYAFDLVRHDFEKEPERIARLVHKLASFFSHASIRLSEIEAWRPAQGVDSRRRA